MSPQPGPEIRRRAVDVSKHLAKTRQEHRRCSIGMPPPIRSENTNAHTIRFTRTPRTASAAPSPRTTIRCKHSNSSSQSMHEAPRTTGSRAARRWRERSLRPEGRSYRSGAFSAHAESSPPRRMKLLPPRARCCLHDESRRLVVVYKDHDNLSSLFKATAPGKRRRAAAWKSIGWTSDELQDKPRFPKNNSGLSLLTKYTETVVDT